MPKISVIIPNYNHARFLKKRIESVLGQSYRDFELIILDDCSTDNSKEVIESYRNNEKVSNIIYNDYNSGTTFKQWQKGLSVATGEYIWIAESDDYADDTFLNTLIAPFLEHPGVAISFCRSVNVDENEHSLGLTLHADVLDNVKWTRDYIEKGTIEVKKYLQYRNTIPNASAVLFRKPAQVEKVLRTDMRYCGDWFFWKNLLKEDGSMIAYSSQPLNFFRTHADSTRHLNATIDTNAELRRFGEYKSFVPEFFMNPFDVRYRWMMAEWIDRGVNKALHHTRYRYFPKLHPALTVRYYFYSIKKTLNNLNPFAKNIN